MNDTEPKVTVVIINYKSGRYLSDCLRALREQRFRAFQVIVADNDSDDDSFLTAKHSLEAREGRCDPRFQFVKLEENVGFARGNNLMVSQVRTPLIALLNPDSIPYPEWFAKLVEAA